jgi:hypothetical protein
MYFHWIKVFSNIIQQLSTHTYYLYRDLSFISYSQSMINVKIKLHHPKYYSAASLHPFSLIHANQHAKLNSSKSFIYLFSSKNSAPILNHSKFPQSKNDSSRNNQRKPEIMPNNKFKTISADSTVTSVQPTYATKLNIHCFWQPNSWNASKFIIKRNFLAILIYLNSYKAL